MLVSLQCRAVDVGFGFEPTRCPHNMLSSVHAAGSSPRHLPYSACEEGNARIKATRPNVQE